MKLTTISDLHTNQDLKPFLEVIQGLGDHYLEFIRQDTNGYRYEVVSGAEKDRKPGIHASEISGCARRLVYGIGNTERRPDPTGTDANMRMRFRLGQAVHCLVQDEFERMCRWRPYLGPDGVAYTLSFVPEVRINATLGGPAAEHGVESSSDGIFTLSVNGEPRIRFLLEIKTASKDEYDKLSGPKPEHIEQCHLYMACLDLPLTWTLYYNKSNSNFTKPYAPHLFRFSTKLWESLEMRFVLNTHRAAVGELPDRTESMACKWCPFGYTCQPAILNRRTTAAVSNAQAARGMGRIPR